MAAHLENAVRATPMTREDKKVIFASSLGAVFEWYDFYLYGSLASIIGKQFFSSLNQTSQFLFALLAFSAGFAVRPFGAIVFGRLGDMLGRKYTFLITILLMGLSTFFVGILPAYASIGIAAPIILITLRMVQGLALGGEYGGAATYVAEHAPPGKRGAYTSWIQTTATCGLLLSLIILLGTRTLLGETVFASWGWRVPFIVSIVLLGVSLWIRLSLSESPAFQKMKDEGTRSKAPLTEAFGTWKNLKIVLLSLVGLMFGQTVVFFTGQFYALFFLTQVLKVDSMTASIIVGCALVVIMPFFVICGTLSDRIGRKPIIMAGCLLAALTYFPLFKAMTHFANPALERAMIESPAVVVADPKTCHFQFEAFARPGKPTYASSCDLATAALANASASYTIESAPAGTIAFVKLGQRQVQSFEGGPLDAQAFKVRAAEFNKSMSEGIQAAGYPAKADDAQMNKPMVWLIIVVMALYATMVYGPVAAMMVELFPTRIRYTSMSLPYHIGNGWFGGFQAAIGFAMIALNGNIYYGLWYPVVMAVITLAVGIPFVRETRDVDIYAND